MIATTIISSISVKPFCTAFMSVSWSISSGGSRTLSRTLQPQTRRVAALRMDAYEVCLSKRRATHPVGRFGPAGVLLGPAGVLLLSESDAKRQRMPGGVTSMALENAEAPLVEGLRGEGTRCGVPDRLP